MKILKFSISQIQRKHETQAQLVFCGHFTVGHKFREYIRILKVCSERSHVIGDQGLARLGSEKFIVLANFNRQKRDSANNSNICNKRQPFVDPGTIHVQSLRKMSAMSTGLSMAALGHWSSL
ncbi:MAG: hypothetical protein OEW35_11890 [Gammaproteobacteria bacterium]|nr:hypothetical protein [Gammaproteobacteria bacterium]MDH5310075.1 hypothetical protein [Gammaproteobacteria bacterium]